MHHKHDYGIVEKGTSADCIVLWGKGFAVLQIDFSEDDHRPIVSLVHDEGMSQIVSIDFKDAVAATSDTFVQKGPTQRTGEVAGWWFETQEERDYVIKMTSPDRKRTVTLQSSISGILIQVQRFSEELGLVMGISMDSLVSMNLWPATPISELVNTKRFGSEKIA